MTQPNKYLSEDSKKRLTVNLMIFDIMFNNEICNLVYLQDASNDMMDVNSEEPMNQTDYSDTNIEHLITNSSSFIVSITNFFHRKFKNSLSLEV